MPVCLYRPKIYPQKTVNRQVSPEAMNGGWRVRYSIEVPEVKYFWIMIKSKLCYVTGFSKIS